MPQKLLLKGHEPVAIGSRALDILIALVERAGEVVSRRELVGRVWPDVVVEEANLRVHIAGLRRALGDGQDGARYIANVPGRGYCFVASVERRAKADLPAGVPPARILPQTLPVRLQRMVGRDETIETLCAEVMSQRFVTVVGPGGVGKTTVAVAAAHELAAEFQDAICFVDLSALKDGALVVSAVASAVGCLSETQDSLPRLLATLADRRILLVLDSCEHVIEFVATLTEGLFREAPEVHIIATSRETLRVQGENVHPLQSLDTPSNEVALTAAEALASPAVRLFVDRAAAGGYRHDLTDEEAPTVADICRQLDGMPLALELTASRASTYGVRSLAQLVGNRLMLLWKGRRSVPRHQTLTAMLDWSYDLLSEQEKSILCTLSIFVGSFTLEMAQAVASDPAHDGFQVLDLVASLVDKSLISVSRAGNAASYRLLDTTRAHAGIKLRERGDADAVARRHALHFAERLAGLRINGLDESDLAAHARHVGDIRSALEWSFSDAGDSSIGVALGAGATPVFLAISMLSECRRWCLRTLDALPEQVRGTRLEIGLQLALAISSHHAHSDSTEVARALERGLSLADSLGDSEYQLELLAGLNVYGTRFADAAAPLAAAERYASIARERGGSREIVAAEWMLGSSHHLVGNQALAQQSYERGFKRAAAAGVGEVHSFGYGHQARALIGCARTLWLRGLPDQAAQLAYEGIEVAGRQAQSVSFSICLAYAYAVPVFLWRGDLQVAEDIIDRLIAHAARYSLASYHAAGLGLRGELMMAKGDAQLGIALLRDALPILQAQQRYIFSSASSRALAEGLTRIGHAAEATIIIDAILADAMRGSGTFEMPDLIRTRGEVLLAASPKNWPEAEASLKNSLDLARRQSSLGWELRSAILLSRWWQERGRHEEARTLLADVYARFTEGFQTFDLQQAARQLRALGARPSRNGRS
ncbi:ATP-binding protein [Bradyrhizobium centrolobii]|uniref:ATP-binding protein n=1 Tax=Bradyrhizobium centrolobii TaxID=1505087 RepID=UPI0010A95EA0|nr:winged helix-turn-helix domain-containing protein [Bradyrhizobium centrolobii]